jgi:hypothetical protein
MDTKRHSYLLMLLFAMAGAFITAFVFVVAVYLSLPPTDLAYHQGLVKTLADPFVITIASTVAVVSGLLVSPVLYFCMRRRRLSVVLPIVFGSTFVTVVILTPFSVILGLLGALAVMIASTLICCFIRSQKFELT